MKTQVRLTLTHSVICLTKYRVVRNKPLSFFRNCVLTNFRNSSTFTRSNKFSIKCHWKSLHTSHATLRGILFYESPGIVVFLQPVIVMHGMCEREQIVASEYLTTENYRGVAHVTVSVMPTNHVAPHFSQTSYSAVIGENSSRGTAVANIAVCRLYRISFFPLYYIYKPI